MVRVLTWCLCAAALVGGGHAFSNALLLSVPTRRHSEAARKPFGPCLMSAAIDEMPLVVVAGATGRVGRMVVENLLNPPANSTQRAVRVRALVRDPKKGAASLPQNNPALEILMCDLLSPEQLNNACGDAAAAVWCATGFSDSRDASFFDKLMGAFKLKFTPQEVFFSFSLCHAVAALPPSTHIDP